MKERRQGRASAPCMGEAWGGERHGRREDVPVAVYDVAAVARRNVGGGGGGEEGREGSACLALPCYFT